MEATMAVADFIPVEQEKAKLAQKKDLTRAERRATTTNEVVSRAFTNAAHRYERQTAKAIVNSTPLRVILDGMRPIEKPSHLLRAVWDSVRFAHTVGITPADIEMNANYQTFKNDLERQGIKVANIRTYNDSGRGGSCSIAEISFGGKMHLA